MEISVTEFEHAAGQTMIAFLRRLSMHYGIYRRLRAFPRCATRGASRARKPLSHFRGRLSPPPRTLARNSNAYQGHLRLSVAPPLL